MTHKIFNFHYDKYKESFNKIEYVSPNEDYDKYCNYIKSVDNIQSITKFFINCLNYSICSPDNIIDLLLLFQQKMIDHLEIEEKINKYGFANDRADVIDFGLKIYERIIKKLEIKTIQSTKWGVSDSIAVKIFHEIYSKKISIYNEK